MTPPPRLRQKRYGQLRWTLRDDWPITWWREVLVDPEAWLRDPARFFKDSSNVTVARIPSPAATYPNLVLRRIKYGRLRQKMRDLFRASRAQRALRRALALEAAQVPVSSAIAAADIRHCRWPSRAYLLSMEIAPARTLKQTVREHQRVPRPLERPLAELLARLHTAGFTHGDLKATNILLKPDGQPWFIDFDGVRQFSSVPRKWALKDLARLAAGIREADGELSLRTAARFLRHYCALRQLPAWPDWCREAARLLGANRAKGQPRQPRR